MKKDKIIFWITTTIIFLFEGVLVALTSQSEMAVKGITGLGYPVYFGTMLAVFKVLGTIVLMVPKFPKNVKEWAYAGFGIDFIAALVSLWVVNGFGPMLIMPVAFIAILILSYRSYHKLNG
ncbi:MAG: DoxX family protein [Candidatus Magasanikbacteria bacterium]|nr:DoxX family protein [Candidatus Magasanikbacteria bacterium]